MFFGEYQHTVDPKGRVIMPAKLREGLGEKFIVTKGLDNCLFVYSYAEWGSLEKELITLPFTDIDVRAFLRFLFAGAYECEVDKQGRILIPMNLREYASLDKDIYILGVSARVEIWQKEKWENYNINNNACAVKISEKMASRGFKIDTSSIEVKNGV